MNITKTANPIHFTDMEPHRFEQLAYELLNNIYKFKRLDVVGLKGNDGGADLIGISNSGEKYYVQCKREAYISHKVIKDIVDKIAYNYEDAKNSTLIYFFACDISAQATQFAYKYAEEKGFSDAILYTNFKIEAELYNHKNLLNKYFSLSTNNTSEDKILQRKQDIANHHKFDHIFLREQSQNIIGQMPLDEYLSSKFKKSRFILRSIHSDTYDDPEENIQPTWYFHNYIYDALDNGIEFMSLMPPEKDIIVNLETKEWHFKTDNEKLTYNTACINNNDLAVIGLVPYHEIIETEEDGDQTFSDPILHCNFSYNETPFKEIYYKYKKENINFKENKPIEPLGVAKLISRQERLHRR